MWVKSTPFTCKKREKGERKEAEVEKKMNRVGEGGYS
jgi:hypothetical protein